MKRFKNLCFYFSSQFALCADTFLTMEIVIWYSNDMKCLKLHLWVPYTRNDMLQIWKLLNSNNHDNLIMAIKLFYNLIKFIQKKPKQININDKLSNSLHTWQWGWGFEQPMISPLFSKIWNTYFTIFYKFNYYCYEHQNSDIWLSN